MVKAWFLLGPRACVHVPRVCVVGSSQVHGKAVCVTPRAAAQLVSRGGGLVKLDLVISNALVKGSRVRQEGLGLWVREHMSI